MKTNDLLMVGAGLLLLSRMSFASAPTSSSRVVGVQTSTGIPLIETTTSRGSTMVRPDPYSAPTYGPEQLALWKAEKSQISAFLSDYYAQRAQFDKPIGELKTRIGANYGQNVGGLVTQLEALKAQRSEWASQFDIGALRERGAELFRNITQLQAALR